jgi:hypothetical protein
MHFSQMAVDIALQQVTAIGDILLSAGSGSGVLPHGFGAYIAAVRSDHGWSWIGQSMDAPANATTVLQLQFTVAGIELPSRKDATAVVRVWWSTWKSNTLFQRETDITVGPDGRFELALQPHEILSLTTGPDTKEGHGSHPQPPAPSPFPFPFTETFIDK